MKNLFLTSTFEEVSHLFKEFEKSETRVKKVTFIPTASVCEEVIFYVDAGREALEGLGLIVEQINLGKTYIGESAGSVILAADIEYISEMDAPEVANNLDSFDALDVIDFFHCLIILTTRKVRRVVVIVLNRISLVIFEAFFVGVPPIYKGEM